MMASIPEFRRPVGSSLLTESKLRSPSSIRGMGLGCDVALAR